MLQNLHFGLEVEALSGPAECPFGTRGTDHGGAVHEYRFRPLTLKEWAENRESLREFFSTLKVDGVTPLVLKLSQVRVFGGLHEFGTLRFQN